MSKIERNLILLMTDTKIYDAYSKALPIYEDENLTIVRYDLMTRKQIIDLDKRDALALVAVSPLEVHGDYLPLGSDFIESLLMNELIKSMIKERKKPRHYTIVDMPPLPIGTGSGRGLVGTINIKHATFRNLMVQYLEGIVKAGFRRILMTSVHHGNIHAYAMEEAAIKVMKKYKKEGVRIVSPLNWIVKKIYVDNPTNTWASVVEKLGQSPLSEEEYQALFNDHHASIMEISFVKKINPNLVDPMYKTCTPKIEGILQGLKPLITPDWLKKANKEGCGYNGHPARADSRNWYVLYESLVKDVGEEFIDALYHKSDLEFKKYTKSFMWPIIFLRTNWKWRGFYFPLLICILCLLYFTLFPWTLIPIISFMIYMLIRAYSIVNALKQD